MTLSGQDRLEELRARLEAIAEDLADLGQAKLAEMLDDQNSTLETEERRITRARRAVLKAADILGSRIVGPGADGDA
jgi:hypothetical protein